MTGYGPTVATYAVLVGLLVLLEVAARCTALGVPTLRATLAWVMRHRAGQVAVLLVWWWLGWHFLAAS